MFDIYQLDVSELTFIIVRLSSVKIVSSHFVCFIAQWQLIRYVYVCILLGK